MKLSNFKKILIIILFFLFFIVIDSKCFASSDDFTIEISLINSNFSDYYYKDVILSRMSSIDSSFSENDLADFKYILFYLNYVSYVQSWCHFDVALSKEPFFLYENKIVTTSPIIGFTCYPFESRNNFSFQYRAEGSFNSSYGYAQACYGYFCDTSALDKYSVYSNYYLYTDSTLSTVYTNSNLTKNDDFFPIVVVSPIVYETPTLYIDDMNFKKRFKFSFNIPMVRDDTKYYVFLEDYNRISYSSVSATFRIFTVTTPEGFDYTDYENYMYYDDRLKDTNLILPAGCEIHEFSTICSNNNVAELNEIQTYTASRLHFNISVFLELQRLIAYTYNTFDDNTFVNYFNYLYPTDYYISDEINYSFSHFISSLLNTFTFDTIYSTCENIFSNYFNDVTISNQNHYSYYSSLLLHYYSDYKSYNFYKFNFNDFVFSNGCIVSYEPKKYDSNLYGTIYNLYRKTKVYNQNNKIEDIGYIFNYTDSEDVSSMLPSGTSVEYLTSPFYRDNESSSSGGYITYDINEILQGDKIIDYSKEDNSIHNNFNADYIENYTEGDNIVINNYYTNEIDKTSDEHLLHNIYLAILEIKLKLSDIGDSISNTTNNFTYNIENTVKYYFIPNSYAMDSIKEELQDTAAEHLGIIYQPFQRHTIYFYCYFWYCY